MIIKAAETFANNRANYDGYRILGYAKPVKIIKCPNNYNPDNYVEREWRKVYANPAPQKWLTETEYKAYRGAKGTAKRSVSLPLTFKASEIDFIIVNRKDLKSLQDFIINGSLVDVGGKHAAITMDERVTLLSKILVREDLIHNL